MYACGLRISEAASLEVTAVDGKNGLIRVVGKGNKERSVSLPEPVLAELRWLWKAHGNRRWLCPNARGDGPVTRHALWQTFKKVIAETGIKARVTPHWVQRQRCPPSASVRQARMSAMARVCEGSSDAPCIDT